MRTVATTAAVTAGGGGHLLGRAVAALAAAAIAAGCGTRAGAPPRPASITPSRGAVDVSVPVVIRGDGFGATVDADFSGGGGDVVDARFQAFLGTTPLEDVALRQDGALQATVPADLAVGTYDLTVVDPSGRAGRLAQAYRVLAASASGAAVARFHVDPVGAQVATSPFTVVVTAVDDTGAVVRDYEGEVQLSDLSGAMVPPSLGLFVDGQWVGQLEVRAARAADVLTVADPAGATGASAAFDVAPAPAAAVLFDGAFPPARAGACAGPVTVSLRDAYGAPAVAAAPIALSVTAAPGAGFALHADPACAAPSAGPTVPAGQGTVSFWFVATAAGPLQLTVAGDGLAGDAVTGTVAAGPPAALAFVTSPRTATAGACSAAATVEVRDAWGNPTTAGVAGLSLAADPAAGLTLYSDACRTPATSLDVAAGATTASLWFSGTVAGAVRVTISGGAGLAASQDERIDAGDAAGLAFTTPPRAARAGACSADVTVGLRDAYGNAAAARRAVRLGFSPSPAGLALYADATCTTAASGIDLAAGARSATVYYRGTAAGAYALAVSAPSLGGASQPERVDPAPPAAVVFTSAPRTVPVAACSGAVAIALQDVYGNPTAAAAGLQVALGAAPAGATFYSDAACAVPAAAAEVPAGAGAAVFSFRPVAVGGLAVTAAADGLVPATQAETIVAGAAAQLAFATAPQAVAAGACSGVVTVQSRDASGNPSAISAVAATAISLSAPGLTLYARATCTGPAVTSVSLAAGASAASFYFLAGAPGSATITASAPGVSSASQAETIAAPPATRLVLTTAPQSVTAGACSSAVTVEGRDGFGNPGSLPATLSLGAPALTLYADPACAGAPVAALAAGGGATAASLWFRGTTAGPAAVTVSAAGVTSASQGETIVPAAASQLAFVSAAQTVTAGACSGAVTLQARDPYGNPVALSGSAATAVGLTAGALTLYADPGCSGAPITATTLAAGATTTTFRFSGGVAGPATVAASAGVPGVASATQIETIVPAPATQLAFATPPQTLVAGACSGPLTIEARDAFGNAVPVSGSSATTLALSAPGLALFADPACAGAPVTSVSLPAGATSASVRFRGTAAGAAPVTGSAGALSVARQTETIVPAAAVQLAFTGAPQTVAAGVCSGLVGVQARDAYGNAVSAAAATGVALSAPALALFADATCSGTPISSASIAPGTTTASFAFRGTVAGPAPIVATGSGLASATQVQSIVAAAATRLVFTTGAQTIAAGACSAAASLRVLDPYGNAVAISPSAAATVTLAAAGLTLHGDGACAGAPLTALTLPAGATDASFHFRGTVAASRTITASASGIAPATQVETIVAAAASQLAFTTAAQTVAAGTCSAAATVEARDAWGNAAAVSASLPATVALSAGTLTLHADPACATAPVTSLTLDAGASDVTFYFGGTAAGPAPVAAAVAGLSGASQTETISAAAASQLAFTTPARTVQAGGCSGAVTIEARDAWGNPGPVSSALPTAIALDGGGLALHASAGCGGGAVTAVTLAPAATTATFWFTGTAPGPHAVVATAAGLAGAGQLETVTAGPATHLAFTTAAQAVAAGACSAAVTVESRDAFDNPAVVSSTAGTPITLAATGLSFYAGAGCAGAAVGAATLAAGATVAAFSFRGTAAGTVAVTASAAALGAASQPETIVAGPLDHWAWATVASPQLEAVAFVATITAVDLYGNRRSDTGPVTLSASTGTVTCASACTSSTVTAVFSSGQWVGTVVVPAAASGVTLAAAGAGRTGTSNAFDVAGPASRSPPLAAFTASARVITSGGSVTFDASASSDYQTPAASLTVSWYFEARDGDYAAAVVPPGSPWTAWSSARTATHAFLNNTGQPIVFRPRLAVRDTEAGPGGPDVGYASGVVVVLPDASNVCVVDTDSLVDDSGGSTSCNVKGPDGRTSLAEAIRVANASAATTNVVFSGVRHLTSAGTTLTLNRPVRIVADPGAVVLEGVSLGIAATDVLVSGLELTGLASPLTVSSGGDALLEDLSVHDGQGIEVQGRARIVRARMSGCAGAACIRASGASAYVATFFSDLRGAGTDVGIALDTCAGASPTAGGASPYLVFSNGWSESGAAFVGATVLTGFGTAVRLGAACPTPWITNVTFDRNGTGIAALGAAGYVLDSIFTRQTVSAMSPAACTLSLNTRNLVWQNAANGCAGAGAALISADPLFVYPAARDYRIQYGSPARDAANGGNAVEVDDAGPGLWLGAAPDRGGRETY